MEGLGSSKATPNLDIEFRGLNYTTTILELAMVKVLLTSLYKRSSHTRTFYILKRIFVYSYIL